MGGWVGEFTHIISQVEWGSPLLVFHPHSLYSFVEEEGEGG